MIFFFFEIWQPEAHSPEANGSAVQEGNPKYIPCNHEYLIILENECILRVIHGKL